MHSYHARNNILCYEDSDPNFLSVIERHPDCFYSIMYIFRFTHKAKTKQGWRDVLVKNQTMERSTQVDKENIVRKRLDPLQPEANSRSQGVHFGALVRARLNLHDNGKHERGGAFCV